MGRFYSRVSGLLLASAFGFQLAAARASVVSTTYADNNSNNGEVFQVQAINSISITGFDVNLLNNAAGFSIYEHNGALTSQAANQAAFWGSPIFTGGAVSTNGAGAETQLTNALNIALSAGSTDSFLILVSSGSVRVGITNGGALGSVLASDSNLNILEGWAETENFGVTGTDREANVSVIYSAVPELSTWAMMLLGSAGFGFMAYRKRTTVRFA